MDFTSIKFSGHSLQRMFERDISPEIIEKAIIKGEIIEEYPDDKPYPSFLLLFTENNVPLHVVAAIDKKNETVYIITGYYPDPVKWDNDFKKRKK